MKFAKVFPTAFLLIGLFVSCEKSNNILDIDTVVSEIALSDSKETIEPSDLSSEIANYIEFYHFDSYIESASRVRDRGFEIVLGSGEILYFDTEGRNLRPIRHPFGHGPCGRGEILGAEDLPENITDYINENYPDAEIYRAKHNPNFGYLVGVEGGLILIFNADGEFVEEATRFFHCRNLGEQVRPEELPTNITDYVNDHYSNAEIKRAFKKNNGNYILAVLTDDGRKILVFDEDGNLLFERG